MPARSIFITNNGLSDHIGIAQVLPYLEGLAARGYAMECISVESPERKTVYEDHVKPRLEKSDIKHLPIIRSENMFLRKLERLTIPRRMYSLLQESIASTSPDVLHCRSFMPLSAVLKAARQNSIPFIFDMRGFWIDERLESGIWNGKNPFFKPVVKYFRRLESEAFRHAAGVVVLTDSARKVVEARSDLGRGIITIVPCSVDHEIFTPNADKRSVQRERIGLGRNDLVLAYLGSAGPLYRVDVVYRILERLNTKQRSAKILFLGDHDVSEHIKQARAIGITLSERDIISRRVPHNKVPLVLSAADFGLAFRIQSFSSLGVSATKTGEYIACGLPVISNEGIGDINKIITHGETGCILRDFSDNEIDDTVEKLIGGGFLSRDEIHMRGRDLFTMTNAIELYNDLYCNVVEANRAPA